VIGRAALVYQEGGGAIRASLSPRTFMPHAHAFRIYEAYGPGRGLSGISREAHVGQNASKLIKSLFAGMRLARSRLSSRCIAQRLGTEVVVP